MAISLIELVEPAAPPASLYLDLDVDEVLEFESALTCGGTRRTWFDRLTFDVFAKAQRLPAPHELTSGFYAQTQYGKPSGTALFLKSDIDQFDKDFGLQPGGLSIHTVLQWLNYTLGATCGVGLGYVEAGSPIEPHIRLSCLPQSQMRGAIGWTWGPPLARNRTMQLSKSVTAAYYRLRLIQHEFGHFLGHYGWPSHSNRIQDIMYPSLQHIKAASPRWGKTAADVEWEVKTFGAPWIVE